MKYTIVLILTLFFITSCKQEFASQEIANSYKSVMTVHDEVMPEINTIQRLKKSLRPYKENNSEVLDLMKNLEAADDGMMDWMRGFKLDKSASKENQLKYLEAEQTKINKVSKDMRSSISEAQDFLSLEKQK